MTLGRKAPPWDELHAALPAGWWVGQPSYHPERQEWLLYAYDPSERPVLGVRKREWQAIAAWARLRQGKCQVALSWLIAQGQRPDAYWTEAEGLLMCVSHERASRQGRGRAGRPETS